MRSAESHTVAFRRRADCVLAILAIGFGQFAFALHHDDHASEPFDDFDRHCAACAVAQMEPLATLPVVAIADRKPVAATVDGVSVDAYPRRQSVANSPRAPPLS